MGDVVDLRIAGQSYRLTSSASEAELRRLAGAVNEKIAQIPPSARGTGASVLLLAALALAHDVEEERARTQALRGRTRSLLEGIRQRLQRALGEAGTSAPGQSST